MYKVYFVRNDFNIKPQGYSCGDRIEPIDISRISNSPLIDFVRLVEADGRELEAIIKNFDNLPSKHDRLNTWFGDTAKMIHSFIVNSGTFPSP